MARLAYGTICYELKTPYKNGTTHVVFEPLDFIARLAALVPKPRVHLTRFHGVFAPNSRYRAQVTNDNQLLVTSVKSKEHEISVRLAVILGL